MPNENCSLLTGKKTKSESKMSPKILLEKNEESENRKGEEKERRRREEKKEMVALLVFMLTSFERKKLFEGRALFWL